MRLAKPYLDHSEQLKYFQHPNQEEIFKIKGLVSRFSKKMEPKKYIILLKIPKEGEIKDILSYCTCKTGSRTLGGCFHSTAILFHLTIDIKPEEASKKKNSPTAKNKLKGIIDIRPFKKKKINSKKEKYKEAEINQ